MYGVLGVFKVNINIGVTMRVRTTNKRTRKDIKVPERLGEERLNKQGCLAKIIKYNEANDIIIQFQDEYKAEVHTSYRHFSSGNVKNPYYPSVHGIGILGTKYPAKTNKKMTKEYDTWFQMIRRCFDKKEKEKCPVYKDVTCCKEWLLYENFYEWLHGQSNFDKWLNSRDNKERWCLDKDILIKENKVYSPETCCLVPNNVNVLFTNRKNYRGSLPIGVTKHGNQYMAQCMNPFTDNKKQEYLGTYPTIEETFQAYKSYKENIIKQVAEKEYAKGNITKECYEAMMNYQVEITD